MGFFGGKRSQAAEAQPAPVKTDPSLVQDRGSLAEIAVRGGDAAARSKALEKLLADPVANVAALAIVAVQSADQQAAASAAKAVGERRLLKDIARKAKTEPARAAAQARLTELDAEVSKPSPDRARAERQAALEALIPRATRCAVSGDQTESARVAGERDAILAQHQGLPEDERCAALVAKLRALGDETTRRAAELAEAARIAAANAAAAQAAQAAAAATVAPAAVAPPAPIEPPAGLEDLVVQAETAAAGPDLIIARQRLLVLHKDWSRLASDLPHAHLLRIRFVAAWDGLKTRQRTERAQRGERRAASQAQLEELCTEVEALAGKADSLAPDAVEALEAHRQALDGLRNRWRDSGGNSNRGFKERFQKALDDAYAPLRAAREAADWERFANLERAEALTAEVAALPVSSDPAAAFRGLKDAQQRWRKLGPLPREKARAAWDAFRSAGDNAFLQLKTWLQAQDLARAQVAAAKRQLCEQAEEIAATKPVGIAGSPADRDARKAAIERMKGLQAAWRDAGQAPRDIDQELWRRFRAAQDAFWGAHKAEIDARNAEQGANQEQKELIIKAAEEFAAAAERAKTSGSGLITAADVQRRIGDLRRQWREIGFVPRESREALERRLGDAIDRSLATIKEHLEAARAAEEEALAKRRLLITELEEVVGRENARWYADDVTRIKEAWRSAGRVPRADLDALERRFGDLLGKWRSSAG